MKKRESSYFIAERAERSEVAELICHLMRGVKLHEVSPTYLEKFKMSLFFRSHFPKLFLR